MSTHKHFDKICCVVLAAVLLLTVLFMNAESLGVRKASAATEYESRLFDTSAVHTIDIIMDDWDEFTANCKSEEYSICSVVIDNEAFKNVAIRGKGNTSLTQVESYGNDRYSFKIEFDHYDSTNTYYGLDKLCLNNIIQDNTYMKDYLAYRMMAEAGVASPLCSYVYITVNGEDWGLYLAVEGVEESFLQRSYGSDYGELYKPDSQSMGGGRGNGGKFDMEEFFANDTEADATDSNEPEKSTATTENSAENTGQPFPEMPEGEMPASPGAGEMTPDGMRGGQMQGNDKGVMTNGSDDVLLKYIDDNAESYANIFDNAKTDVSDSDKARLISSLKRLSSGEALENTVNIEKVIRYFTVHNFVLNFDSYTGSMIHNYYLYEKDGQMEMIPWDYNLAFGGFESAAGAADLVNYPIDSPVSGGSAEDRPMIAWIFANEEYTELYHQYFSEFISEYFDSGYFESMTDSVFSMIAPYVEKDPTKFCTYEEFEKGVSALKEFCHLRAESIAGQLNGTIGSTSDTQTSDTLIDTGDLQISDMGSMNNTAGGKAERPDGNAGGNIQPSQGETDNDKEGEPPDITGDANTGGTAPSDASFGQMQPPFENQNGMGGGPDFSNTPEFSNGGTANENNSPPAFPDGEVPVDPDAGNTNGQAQQTYENGTAGATGQTGNTARTAANTADFRVRLGVSACVLVFGLCFALLFKRRR